MKLNLKSSQGGLNLRDSLDSMPERDCLQMDNLIPDVGTDKVRKGWEEVSTQMGEDLYSYNVVSNQKLLVLDRGSIYDLNVLTGVRTVLKSGLAKRVTQSALFTDAAGLVHMFIANGSNPVQDYNGTVIADAGYTGASNLRSPLSFKNRMYFVEDNKFSIWYSEPKAIAGALTEFPVDNFFTRGGEISSINQWTQDGGEGMDDQFVIVSTEGEVLVYSGLSPADSSWSLKGRYNISKPLGLKSTLEQGGDVIVLTQQGVFPLSQVLSQDRANTVPVSDKINEALKDANVGDNWNIHFYSKEGWYIVNKPSGTQYKNEQLILNFKTLAWCRFLGYDALNWAILGDNLYFCNSRGVGKANTGFTDNGTDITYYKQQAYSQLGQVGIKQIQQVKPRFGTVGSLEINRRIGVDFKIGDAGTTKSTPTGVQTLWDEAIWDVDFWSDEFKIQSFKTTSFAPAGDFISIGFFGEVDEETSFSSTEAQVSVGNGVVW